MTQKLKFLFMQFLKYLIVKISKEKCGLSNLSTRTSCNICLHCETRIVYLKFCVHILCRWTITSFLSVQVAFSSGFYHFFMRNYRRKFNSHIHYFRTKFINMTILPTKMYLLTCLLVQMQFLKQT